MQNTRAQSGLCVVFLAYACFTNDHTGETNEISTSTRERKRFLILKLVYCAYFTQGHTWIFLCLCLCLFHKCEPGLTNQFAHGAGAYLQFL